MEQALLIQGGTVIDGTGGGAVRADVRIENGQIEQIRPGLSPREEIGRASCRERV